VENEDKQGSCAACKSTNGTSMEYDWNDGKDDLLE
jgi:hypothetical protein